MPLEKNLKILIITLCVPYPLNSGGNISQYAVLASLQDHIDITLCVLVDDEDKLQAVEILKSKLKNIHIEVINMITKPSALQGVKQTLRKGLKKIFTKPANNAAFDKDDFDNLVQPVMTKGYRLIESYIKIINSNNFDVIQIEFFELLDLVHIIPKNIASVFVHHEIRFKRLLTSFDVSSKNAGYKNYAIDNMEYLELGLLNKFDCVLTFSDHDKNLLKKSLSNQVAAIPFPILQEEFKSNKSDNKIDKLIFLGGDTHHPNRDGVTWFIETVFPDLWSEYKLPLYIIGNWSKESVTELSVADKIVFTGFLNDVSSLSNSALICPIRVGSGIRAKILYAMAKRIPVISTTVGSEGLGVENSKHLFIADNLSEFTFAVKKLLFEPDRVRDLTENAYQFVEDVYSQKNITKRRLNLYQKLVQSKALITLTEKL